MRAPHNELPAVRARTPKVLGADVELGNFILGMDAEGGTGRRASRALLDQIPGVPSQRDSTAATWSHNGWQPPTVMSDPQDRDRRFLPATGGCAYIDLDHLELALPETVSAFDHVAHWRAMLLLARGAMARADRSLPNGHRLQVLVNNSDGLGHSYGAHANVLLTRAAWDNIILRKPHYLAFLCAFQVSSIVFTGQGKVGSENGRPHVDYQLSQRADFIETLVSEHTTYNRPVVNSRDEPLCGSAGRTDHANVEGQLARLHVIFFDSTLCQVASLLRAGALQIVVAMLEAGCVDASLALDDPLDALHAWSADPTLRARATTVGGDAITAVELQERFLAAAKQFADAGRLEGIVPRADEILALWEDTLVKLRDGDFAELARRLDWVLKLQILRRARARRPDLTWQSPQIKHLDHVYASLDPTEGLFWAYEAAGLVDLVVSHADVARAASSPPVDTRAWTRAHLLRLAGADRIDKIDWDAVTVMVPRRRDTWQWLARCTITLPRPYDATQAQHDTLFRRNRSLEDIVEALEAGGHLIPYQEVT